MTSIRSFAEILRSGKGVEQADATRFVGIIHEESMRLTRLLDEILDLSFLESGRVRWKLEEIVLGDVIQAAVTATEGLRSQRNVGIRVAPEPMDLTVTAEFDRLAQVIINLISNAVKYGTSDNPQIDISARLVAGDVQLDVVDNGPGIPPQDAERVFEKFSRLGEATLAGSAGLGLPISREIMRNLGGDLILVPGHGGARFRVILKRQAASQAAAE